jgi:methionyl-tRNA formyltransferase
MIAVAEDDDTGTLHDKLASLGAEMMIAALKKIESGDMALVPQPAAGATYAPKIGKRETVIDWRRPAAELERAIRAFRPSPGASTHFAGESLKVWRARCAGGHGLAGQVLRTDPDFVVACGEGALEILELQRAGGRRLDAALFLRGHPIVPGARFG